MYIILIRAISLVAFSYNRCIHIAISKIKKKTIQHISKFKEYKYKPYKKQKIIDLKPIKISYFPYSFEDYGIIGYKINAGYHSYDTIERAKRSIFFGDEVVIKCIIPKNTEYYINNYNEIVSSTIIVTDQIVY